MLDVALERALVHNTTLMQFQICVFHQILFCLGSCILCESFNSSQYSALKALYDATAGEYWTYNEATDGHWNFSDSDPCIPSPWEGLECSASNVSIININLTNFDLKGKLPGEAFENLTSLLTLIFVENNELVGPIPRSIGESLSNLIALDLSYNALTGSIPAELGSLSVLEELNLGQNTLTGSIPAELGNLSVLEYLALSTNKLTGSIPRSIGESLSNLIALDLSYNALTGSIPAELGSLSVLEELDLGQNTLTGSIPSALGGLSKLSHMVFYNNELTGEIPSSVWDITTLLVLGAPENRLTGTLSPSIGNLLNLQILYLQGNKMTGTIPESIGNLKNLSQLNLQNNNFHGTISESLGNLVNLRSIYLSKNRLSGKLTDAMIEKWTQLQESTFSSNSFAGNIPSKWSQQLITLDLSNNQFTGQIPSSIFDLPNLNTLAILVNCLSLTLPDSICKTTSIKNLILDGLRTSSNCKPLSYEYTTLPPCIWSLSSIQQLSISGNAYAGQMENVQLYNLTELDISHNDLRGVVPDFFNNRSMQVFDIAHNKITGSLFDAAVIPNSTSARYSAEVNRLSGALNTKSLEKFLSVKVLVGGLFSCATIPQNDKASEYYVCGSHGLEYSVYFYLIICFIFMAVVSFLRYRKAFKDLYHKWLAQTSSENLTLNKKGNSTFPQTILMVDSLNQLCKFAALISICITIADLVIYSSLKYGASNREYRTDYYQYMYELTGAFLQSPSPAFVLFSYHAFVTFMIVYVFCIIFARKGIMTEFKSSSDNIEAEGSKSSWFVRHIITALSKRIGVSAVIIISIFVNVGYVSLINTLNVWEAVFFRLAFLVVSGSIRALVPMAVMYAFRHTPSRAMCVLISVTTFLDIAVPFMATVYISPLCIHDYFYTQESVSVHYDYEMCIAVSSDNSQVCEMYTTQNETLNFTPPFVYSAQCRNAVIMNYLPVVIYSSAFQSFVFPIIYFLSTYYIEDLKQIITIFGYKIEASKMIMPNMMIHLCLLCAEFILFLTYGVICPYAALAIGGNLCSQAYMMKLFICRYHYFKCRDLADEESVSEKESHIESICKKCMTSLPSCIWHGVAISSILFSLYLFEMAFDTDSEQEIGAPLAVLFLTLTVPLCARIIFRYFEKSENPTRTLKDLSNVEVEISEASIVQNPILVSLPALPIVPFFNISTFTVIFKDSSGEAVVKSHDEPIVSPDLTRKKPSISFDVRLKNGNYTLMMIDLDASYGDEQYDDEFVHWVVVNIPSNGEISHGEEVCSYIGAEPWYNSGLHRYHFLLYFQEGGKLSPKQCQDASIYFKSRSGVRCCDWIKSLASIYDDNAVPTGFNSFKSAWSPYVDIVHDIAKFIPPEPYRSPSQVSKVNIQVSNSRLIDETKIGESKKQSEVATEKGIYIEQTIESNKEILPPRESLKSNNDLNVSESTEKSIGVDEETVLEGRLMHKKFAHEHIYQKRFCWIDPNEKKLFWCKSDTKEKPKSVNLQSDIIAINLLRNKISFTHTMGQKSSIDLEIYGTLDDVAEAERWYKVAIGIHYEHEGQ